MPGMPICCATDAANSAVPQHSPPIASVLRCKKKGTRTPLRRWFARRAPISPSKNTHASQLRPAKKVYAPIYPPPTLWATNAVPQINEQPINNRVLRNCFVSIYLPL